MKIAVVVLYIIALSIIGLLLYSMVHKPSTKKKIKIYAEDPAPAVIRTQHWGYGWRPWWRKYDGVPGFGEGKPLPEPKMPVAPKPIIINTRQPVN
jgi:hypothetical protein